MSRRRDKKQQAEQMAENYRPSISRPRSGDTPVTYEEWRDELFNHPPDADPVLLEYSEMFYAVPTIVAFDFVDKILVDPEVHKLYSKDQLGHGLQTIYCNTCSDLPFLYTAECDEKRRLAGIRNLINLYRNFFERYCAASLPNVGSTEADGPMGFICYMLWDVFVLYPGNASPAMISAAVNVMKSVLDSGNESCLASVIHGLGHWTYSVPEASLTLQKWLRRPTTTNPKLIKYAHAATTGMIL